MLFLNESEIKQAITMKEMIDAIDCAYKIYHANSFNMPTRLQVSEKDNTLLLMPCLVSETIATKLVTVFPKNYEKNLPTIYGLVILNDQETGEVKAILDGAFLTGMRTGAVGGSAIRHLAKDRSKSLAVIGTGVQGLYQTIAACTERPIKHIYAYNRTPSKVSTFKEKLKQWIDPNIQIEQTSSAAEAIKQADIVITATTATNPVLPNDSRQLKDKLYVAIGSFKPHMRELPQTCFQLVNQLFIDSEDALKESGDLITPLKESWIHEEQIRPFSTVVTKDVKVNKNETIIFKSTGMALFDTVVAYEIYKNAKQHNIGQQINF